MEPKAPDRMSRRALAAVSGAVLLVAVCAFGAWQLWGGAGRGDGPPSLADSRSTSGPVGAPLGAVESIAATVPADIKATGRLVIGVNVP